MPKMNQTSTQTESKAISKPRSPLIGNFATYPIDGLIASFSESKALVRFFNASKGCQKLFKGVNGWQGLCKQRYQCRPVADQAQQCWQVLEMSQGRDIPLDREARSRLIDFAQNKMRDPGTYTDGKIPRYHLVGFFLSLVDPTGSWTMPLVQALKFFNFAVEAQEYQVWDFSERLLNSISTSFHGLFIQIMRPLAQKAAQLTVDKCQKKTYKTKAFFWLYEFSKTHKEEYLQKGLECNLAFAHFENAKKIMRSCGRQYDDVTYIRAYMPMANAAMINAAEQGNPTACLFIGVAILSRLYPDKFNQELHTVSSLYGLYRGGEIFAKNMDLKKLSSPAEVAQQYLRQTAQSIPTLKNNPMYALQILILHCNVDPSFKNNEVNYLEQFLNFVTRRDHCYLIAKTYQEGGLYKSSAKLLDSSPVTPFSFLTGDAKTEMNIAPNQIKARKIYKRLMTDYFIYGCGSDNEEHVLGYPIYCCDVGQDSTLAKNLLMLIAKEAGIREHKGVFSAVINILTNGRHQDDPLKDPELANKFQPSGGTKSSVRLGSSR